MANHQSNPSQDVSFIMDTEARKPHNKFGTLGSISGIALNPETTGASILAESMIIRQVADKRDMEAGIVATMAEPVIPPPPQSPPVAVAATPAEEPDRRLERQIGIPDFLPAWFFAAGHQRARAVCKIEASGADYQDMDSMWSGTGFLISPNILLTNHHVLNSKSVASRAICIFNYEVDEFGSVQPTDSYRLDPAKLFITSPVRDGLDFTACWIEDAAAEKYGYVPVFRHAFSIKNEDCANIVQHPEGNYKAVVVQHNEVRDQNEIAILYDCDTEGGSSGAAVYNNAWKLVALHHASRCIVPPDPQKGEEGVYRNEGIKMAAIATYLESLSDTDQGFMAARAVLQAFHGVDSAMGFFGSLGREEIDNTPTDLERVTTRYRGEEKDIDICFWNIEWFNKTFRQKLDDVAWEISVQNLDVWVISESSPEAVRALVQRLKEKYQLDYDCAYSEPDAPGAKQTITVLWNKNTVEVTTVPWPQKVQQWLALESGNFKNLDELQNVLGHTEPEKVDGKIFDRYPGRFKVKAILRTPPNGDSKGNPISPFDFYLVPLHLKAMAEGSKRRQFACRILTQAIKYCREDNKDSENDWIIGGDLNATLASGDLSELSKGGMVAATANDAAAQAFTYLKHPYRSLIDHIFLSPNLIERTDSDGIMILARERDTTRDGNPNSDYLNISDHRPIMIRLSLADNKNKSELKPDQEAIRDLVKRLQDADTGLNNALPTSLPAA